MCVLELAMLLQRSVSRAFRGGVSINAKRQRSRVSRPKAICLAIGWRRSIVSLGLPILMPSAFGPDHGYPVDTEPQARQCVEDTRSQRSPFDFQSNRPEHLALK